MGAERFSKLADKSRQQHYDNPFQRFKKRIHCP
jgi:hypothetical protein